MYYYLQAKTVYDTLGSRYLGLFIKIMNIQLKQCAKKWNKEGVLYFRQDKMYHNIKETLQHTLNSLIENG